MSYDVIYIVVFSLSYKTNNIHKLSTLCVTNDIRI